MNMADERRRAGATKREGAGGAGRCVEGINREKNNHWLPWTGCMEDESVAEGVYTKFGIRSDDAEMMEKIMH